MAALEETATRTTIVITYGQRCEDLGRDVREPTSGLECERERRERAEEIRAEEAEVGSPEREDHERDRDPTSTPGDPEDPLSGDLEAEARSSDSSEGATHHCVGIAIDGDVYPHRVRGGGRLADCSDVQSRPRP